MRYLLALLFLPLALQAASTSELQKFSKLPIRFERESAHSYVGRGFGYRVEVTPAGHAITINGQSGERTVRVAIAGANADAQGHGESALVMKTSYFHGKPDAWRRNVANYSKVQFDEVLPGVDVVYHGAGEQFEFDYIVRPGADPQRIVLRYQGQDGLTMDNDGNLVVRVGNEHIVQQLPVIYQRKGESLRLIGGHYVVKNRNTVAFELGNYDHTLPLVIDPVVVYSGFIGGQGSDTAVAIQRTSDGYLYVAGNSRSIDLATSSDAVQLTNAGDQDIFIMKVDPKQPYPDGILSLSYLGGTSTDEVKAMVVNEAGIVYLTGWTNSIDFPASAGQAQATQAGGRDAFYVKFAPQVTGGLLYSSYLGGTGTDQGNAITIDSSGNIYIAGYTSSVDLPMAGNPAQGASAGGYDSFVAIYNDAGTLNYCTYLGGASTDIAQAIAVRPSDGAVVIAGTTTSYNFPTAGSAFDTSFHDGGGDGFIAAIIPYQGLNGLVYGTYLGGSGIDDIRKIAFNAAGQLVVAGATSSTDFPIGQGTYQASNKKSVDLFLTVLDMTVSQGSALVYSTYFGGTDADYLYGMKIGNGGTILLTGYTYSSDLPLTASAIQPTIGGAPDAFTVRFDVTKPGAAGLLYSSYLGGAQIDNGFDVAEDTSGVMYVVGNTNSRQFPIGTDSGNPFPGDYNAFLIGLQPCTVTLSSTGKDFTSTGGTGSFLVTAASDCSWSVRVGVDWLSIQGSTAGVGNGTVNYAVAPNTTTGARQGDVMVLDKKYTVTEGGK